MQTIELTETLTCSVNCEPNEESKIRERLAQYPMLAKAMLANELLSDGYMAGRERSSRRIWANNILNVAELIDRVNPRFPGDSFSPTTLLSLMTTAHLSVEEIDILAKAMPDYSGDRKITVTATSRSCYVTFQHSMKHSGMFYEVAFGGEHGLCYPFTVELTTYTDMDDLRNHWESDGETGCPDRWQTWECPKCKKECKGLDPVYQEATGKLYCYHCDTEHPYNEIESWSEWECNCESEVAFNGSITIEDNFDAEKVGAWIEEHLFEGQQPDED